ncbi:anaphase-promoting complex subunit Apc5 [Xylona heveae TC161]|uniref:Anaphase-promoting complex subunit 5 n=1 Tax=Xylona heveae (strain CBS 132557 / TC161) TaxID=1328760 RepID=A0A165AHS3_XYLHT|nr:anaphase-promoting complex subunit Apc5 [Xylona heveae TC161]KZF20496.1 anaphase-promoting complex subunit Apc5 [Xylona heveae TC161]
MARYLTAPKLGLLALVSLYAEASVPTASSVPILSFLITHIVSDIANNDQHKAELSSTTITIQSFQKVIANHPSTIAGRLLWDLFLDKLWGIDSLDALHEFFDNLGLLLLKSKEEQVADDEQGIEIPDGAILLSRTSPLGAFVRRARIEFTRLQFHDTVMLWKALISYRLPALREWNDRNLRINQSDPKHDLQRLSFDANVSENCLTEQGMIEGCVSADDIEKLLEFQVEEMQSLGTRLPEEVKQHLSDALKNGVMVTSLSHYVKFLDSWRSGDYPSSFDHLHRYFDYTMQNRDRTFYQYALLNLAILQADFGCYSEAVAAMEETIATARENKDVGCLNFSLSWLYHFSKAHPDELSAIGKGSGLGVAREGLAYLKAKAKEAGMFSLLSTTLLSETKLLLNNGESLPSALENVIKASHLNVTKNLTSTIGSQMLLQSSIYGRLGITSLSLSQCDIMLHCYASNISHEEVLKCICRRALASAQSGRYDEAENQLEAVKRHSFNTLKPYQYWTTISGLLRTKRQLHRNDLDSADHLLNQLAAAPCPEPDVSFSISLLRLDLLIRRHSYSRALHILEDLFDKLTDTGADIYWRVRLMSLKAIIFAKCGVPQKCFSVALRAVCIAHQARILPGLWEAVYALALVLINLREYQATANLLDGIMPQVLEWEDCALSAQLYSSLVDSYIGLAGETEKHSLSQQSLLDTSLSLIDASIHEYSKIEDLNGQCEMVAKKATVMHLLGASDSAEETAARYMELIKKQPELGR